MEVEEEVGELDLLGGLGQAMGRQALEAEALELAGAALGEVAAAVAGVPGVRADRDVTGQAARAVRAGAADVDDVADRAGRRQEGAGRDGLSRPGGSSATSARTDAHTAARCSASAGSSHQLGSATPTTSGSTPGAACATARQTACSIAGTAYVLRRVPRSASYPSSARHSPSRL